MTPSVGARGRGAATCPEPPWPPPGLLTPRTHPQLSPAPGPPSGLAAPLPPPLVGGKPSRCPRRADPRAAHEDPRGRWGSWACLHSVDQKAGSPGPWGGPHCCSLCGVDRQTHIKVPSQPGNRMGLLHLQTPRQGAHWGGVWSQPGGPGQCMLLPQPRAPAPMPPADFSPPPPCPPPPFFPWGPAEHVPGAARIQEPARCARCARVKRRPEASCSQRGTGCTEERPVNRSVGPTLLGVPVFVQGSDWTAGLGRKGRLTPGGGDACQAGRGWRVLGRI